MAVHPSILRKRYENLSVEELEEKYEILKKCFYFNTKEEQIEYMIKTYLYASKNTNNSSAKIALEELLKEKTGKEYSIIPKKFDINLSDVIKFITNSNIDPFWTIALTRFFENLDNISEQEKIKFLIELSQDKTSFNEFSKEITKTENSNELYEKYKKIANDYVAKNSIIG